MDFSHATVGLLLLPSLYLHTFSAAERSMIVCPTLPHRCRCFVDPLGDMVVVNRVRLCRESLQASSPGGLHNGKPDRVVVGQQHLCHIHLDNVFIVSMSGSRRRDHNDGDETSDETVRRSDVHVDTGSLSVTASLHLFCVHAMDCTLRGQMTSAAAPKRSPFWA